MYFGLAYILLLCVTAAERIPPGKQSQSFELELATRPLTSSVLRRSEGETVSIRTINRIHDFVDAQVERNGTPAFNTTLAARAPLSSLRYSGEERGRLVRASVHRVQPGQKSSAPVGC